jgi:hypothetical protein
LSLNYDKKCIAYDSYFSELAGTTVLHITFDICGIAGTYQTLTFLPLIAITQGRHLIHYMFQHFRTYRVNFVLNHLFELGDVSRFLGKR